MRCRQTRNTGLADGSQVASNRIRSYFFLSRSLSRASPRAQASVVSRWQCFKNLQGRGDRRRWVGGPSSILCPLSRSCLLQASDVGHGDVSTVTSCGDGDLMVCLCVCVRARTRMWHCQAARTCIAFHFSYILPFCFIVYFFFHPRLLPAAAAPLDEPTMCHEQSRGRQCVTATCVTTALSLLDGGRKEWRRSH